MVILWPVGAAVECGCVLADSWTWLFGQQLPSSAFMTWANRNCSVVLVEEGGTVWVPFGWHLVCLSPVSQGLGQSASDVVVVPYLAPC